MTAAACAIAALILIAKALAVRAMTSQHKFN